MDKKEWWIREVERAKNIGTPEEVEEAKKGLRECESL
jgi:hypothetical protein